MVNRQSSQAGNAILFVIIIMGALIAEALMTFRFAENLSKLGNSSASLISLDSTINRVNFLLVTTNQCSARLKIPGALNTNTVYKPTIEDVTGNPFLWDGAIIGNLVYSVKLKLTNFGRAGAPYTPAPRFQGNLVISAKPKDQKFNFFQSLPQRSLTLFIQDQAGAIICSTQSIFNLSIGPAQLANRKSSLECLDVGGRPVLVQMPAAGGFPAEQYYSCVIPATQFLPSDCVAIGKLMDWSSNNGGTLPGEGWTEDPVAKSLLMTTVAQGGQAYANASYCF